MSHVIAAAGTGGHVYPGLSVGEALVEIGVDRRDILYVGGNRLEATVYPEEGFGFLSLELIGLQRSLTLRNLRIPAVVMRAKKRIEIALREIAAQSVLGMGGYVTIPAALAARRLGIPLLIAEQNAEAGLANRVANRWASRTFVSFPDTGGLSSGEWVGNPVRSPFWSFSRDELRPRALERYDLEPGLPVVGVFGGSLGAGAINEAVSTMVRSWVGPSVQVVHLVGEMHMARFAPLDPASNVMWRRIPFETSMEYFYAASDFVVARAGGAVAELSATATPSVLIPGGFGSAGHQLGNAQFFADEGAAVIIHERELGELDSVVRSLIDDPHRLEAMASSASRIAKPDAAHQIAKAMRETKP